MIWRHKATPKKLPPPQGCPFGLFWGGEGVWKGIFKNFMKWLAFLLSALSRVVFLLRNMAYSTLGRLATLLPLPLFRALCTRQKRKRRRRRSRAPKGASERSVRNLRKGSAKTSSYQEEGFLPFSFLSSSSRRMGIRLLSVQRMGSLGGFGCSSFVCCAALFAEQGGEALLGVR